MLPIECRFIEWKKYINFDILLFLNIFKWILKKNYEIELEN
jgi:hypothetical protein